MASYTQYVHECHRGHIGHWFVAEWSDQNAQYMVPLSAEERRLNGGCFAAFSRTCHTMPHCDTRRQALRAARHIYGPKPERDA